MFKKDALLTGCATMQWDLFGSFSVKSEGTRHDVELAIIVPSSACLLSSEKTCFFKSIFSGVHSYEKEIRSQQ